MKATIWREDLLAAIDRVRHASPAHGSLPILANILIEAADGSIKVRATDLDLEIATTAACDVREQGATTVDVTLLRGFVNLLPAKAQVQLEHIDGKDFIVRTGRARLNLRTLRASDFPDLAGPSEAHTFVVPPATLRGLLTSAAFAIATDKARYNLQGVFLHPAQANGGDVLRAVATNGHMLALADAALPEGAAGFPGIIISQKAASELARLLGGQTSDVTLAVTPRRVQVTIGVTTLTFKPLDAAFPDYARVLPLGNEKLLSVDRATFVGALERVGTAASAKGTALRLDLANGSVTLSARGFVETGKDITAEISGEEEIEASFDGAPLSIGASSRYLAEVTSHLSGPNMAARFGDPGSPILLSRVGEGESDRLFVVMPMHL